MEIKSLVRENILNLKPYSSARGKFLNGILLDANENALGSVVEYNNVNLNRYPDPSQLHERKLIADYLKVNESNIFLGVGSDEVIDLLIRIFCEPGKDNVILNEPTYGMYKVACDINNVFTNSILLTNEFQINFEDLDKTVDEKTKIIFLCSPNNPTGQCLNSDDIKNVCEKYNSIVVVDEAYIDFAENKAIVHEIQNYKNLVVLRTFSKAWGMAGLRCGYCISSKEIINLLFNVKAPYNLNSITGELLKAAFQNVDRKNIFVKSIVKNRQQLIERLKDNKKVQRIFDTDANFILFKVENPGSVYKTLAEKGVIIRDRSNQPMLEGCLRVSVGTKEENEIFLTELEKVL